MNKFNKSNCERLYDYLKEQYPDKFSMDVSDNGEKIVANFGDYDVTFEVAADNGIFLYSQKGNAEFLKQFIPTINIYRNGEEPILQYNTCNINDNRRIVDTTIEWNCNPEQRLKEIKSRGVFAAYPYVIDNIVVFFETKEERDRRMGFTDFSSCYFPNGTLSPFDDFIEMVKNYSEQDAFLVISTLSSVQRQILNRKWKGIWPDHAIVCDALDVVLNKVSLLINNDSNSISSFVSSDSYKDWYNKWNDYFTYDKKCEYMEAKIKGEDVSEFLPECGQSLKKVNN